MPWTVRKERGFLANEALFPLIFLDRVSSGAEY